MNQQIESCAFCDLSPAERELAQPTVDERPALCATCCERAAHDDILRWCRTSQGRVMRVLYPAFAEGKPYAVLDLHDREDLPNGLRRDRRLAHGTSWLDCFTQLRSRMGLGAA